MHEINLFLSASKNVLCAKSIYFYLHRKIYYAQVNLFLTMSGNKIWLVNLFVKKAKNKSIYSRIIRNNQE